MTIIHSNNFSTTLSAAITTTGATSMTLTSVTGAPTLGSGFSCYFTLTDGTNYEIVLASTAPSSTTYSGLTRGAQGTTARTWPIGTVVEINCTRDSLDLKQDAFSYTSTATAAGTTTLTAASTTTQVFTGATTQSVILPVVSTLKVGYPFIITNLSSGVVTVKSSGANTILAMAANTTLFVQSNATSGTAASVWTIIEYGPANGVVQPIALGGTGVSSVTIAPTASSFAGWDTNSNLSANNFLTGYATTATAAGTTTLTITSKQLQYFTGATTQTVVLPAVNTLVTGFSFEIRNMSSGVVTVQSSGANTIQAMAANTGLTVRCISTSGTGTASWQWHYYHIQSGQIVLTTEVTGTLPVLNGGTGVTTSLGAGGSNILGDEGSWTPTFTFSTPGNISVSYSQQTGYYKRFGNMVVISFFLVPTPTYTTAAGNARITGLPFTSSSAANNNTAGPLVLANVTFPIGCTAAVLFINSGTAYAEINAYGPSSSGNFSTTQLTSGGGFNLYGEVCYFI